jgi:hypothetical protein
VSDADDADAADATSARTRKSVVRPSLAECGVNWVCEGRHRPPGAPSWPLPCSGWGPANAPEEKAKWDDPSEHQRLALWRARSGPAACMRAGCAGGPQSAEGGCRRPMPHSAADYLERRKGQSRSVHVGRQTSRLKPRTSSGRVIDSFPFSLVRGDANQRRETPENSTLGSLFLTI